MSTEGTWNATTASQACRPASAATLAALPLAARHHCASATPRCCLSHFVGAPTSHLTAWTACAHAWCCGCAAAATLGDGPQLDCRAQEGVASRACCASTGLRQSAVAHFLPKLANGSCGDAPPPVCQYPCTNTTAVLSYWTAHNTRHHESAGTDHISCNWRAHADTTRSDNPTTQ